MKNRQAFILFTIIAFACSNDKPNSFDSVKDPLFKEYLNSMPTIEYPVDITASLKTDGNEYKYGKFQKFKTIWSYKPFGKLFESNGFIVTVDMEIADNYVPTLVSYDKDGNKVDSLYLYEYTNSEIDTETTDHVYIDRNKNISIITTTDQWDVDATSRLRIQETRETFVDTAIYYLNSNGYFSSGLDMPPSDKEWKNHDCKQRNRYTAEERLEFYPFNKASEVRLVFFDYYTKSAFNHSLPRDDKGKVILSKMKQSTTLSKGDIGTLTNLLFNVGYAGPIRMNSVPDCLFDPQNAILFIDQDGQVFEFYNICFKCGQYLVSSEQLTWGDDCMQKMDLLKELFKNQKIKVAEHN